jgi:hypothetical protein
LWISLLIINARQRQRQRHNKAGDGIPVGVGNATQMGEVNFCHVIASVGVV